MGIEKYVPMCLLTSTLHYMHSKRSARRKRSLRRLARHSSTSSGSSADRPGAANKASKSLRAHRYRSRSNKLSEPSLANLKDLRANGNWAPLSPEPTRQHHRPVAVAAGPRAIEKGMCNRRMHGPARGANVDNGNSNGPECVQLLGHRCDPHPQSLEKSSLTTPTRTQFRRHRDTMRPPPLCAAHRIQRHPPRLP